MTAFATWSSDTPGVVQVVGAGLLFGASPGTAQVSASYDGVTASGSFRVYSGESFAWEFWPGSYTYLSVVDANNQPVAGRPSRSSVFTMPVSAA